MSDYDPIYSHWNPLVICHYLISLNPNVLQFSALYWKSQKKFIIEFRVSIILFGFKTGFLGFSGTILWGLINNNEKDFVIRLFVFFKSTFFYVFKFCNALNSRFSSVDGTLNICVVFKLTRFSSLQCYGYWFKANGFITRPRFHLFIVGETWNSASL